MNTFLGSSRSELAALLFSWEGWELGVSVSWWWEMRGERGCWSKAQHQQALHGGVAAVRWLRNAEGSRGVRGPGTRGEGRNSTRFDSTRSTDTNPWKQTISVGKLSLLCAGRRCATNTHTYTHIALGMRVGNDAALGSRIGNVAEGRVVLTDGRQSTNTLTSNAGERRTGEEGKNPVLQSERVLFDDMGSTERKELVQRRKNKKKKKVKENEKQRWTEHWVFCFSLYI